MSSSSNGRRLAAAPLLAGLLGPVLAGSLFAAAPARAQFFIDDEPEVRLSPRAVVTTLARRGYRDITHPSFDGETYTLTAADPRGIRVRLVLDAFDGAVLERARFEAAPVPPGFVGRPARPGYGWTEDEPAEAGPTPRPDPRPRRVERPRPPAAVAAVPGTPAPAPAGTDVPGAVPYGVNPDSARSRPARPDRAARTPDAAGAAVPGTAAPAMAAPKATPAAPVPPVAPAEAATAPAAPQEPRREASRPAADAKPVEAAPKPASAPVPDVAAKPSEPKPSEPKPSEPKSSEPASATAELPQRQVRVIEGVTPPPIPAQKPAEPDASGS